MGQARMLLNALNAALKGHKIKVKVSDLDQIIGKPKDK